MSQPRRPNDPRPTPLSQRVREFLNQEQWALEIGSLPTFRALGLKVSRVLYLAVRGFVMDRCSARASALTYITILSVVPLLAFAFSLAKGFGADQVLHKQVIRPFLEKFEPAQAIEKIEQAAEEAAATTGDEIDPGLAEERAAEPPSVAQEGVSPADADPGESAQQALASEAAADAGEMLVQAAETILEFVEATNVSSLGIFGLLVLVFTVIKLLGSVEQAFNDIWGIRRSRAFVRKISDYLSIAIIVPILLIVATGLKSSSAWVFLRDELHLAPLMQFGLGVGSFAIIWVGFALMYLFLPNTRVPWSAALIGGVVGGSLWQVAQVLHLNFQIGVANYNAIYAGFAALPVLMFWIYVSWLTVLFGAELTYAFTSEHAYRQLVRDRSLDHGDRQRLALAVAVAAAHAFRIPGSAPNLHELADHLGVPERALDAVLRTLSRAGILVLVDDEHDSLRIYPGRDPDLVRVEDVLNAMRGEGQGLLHRAGEPVDRVVDRTFDERARELSGAHFNRTLRELAGLLHESRSAAPGSESASSEAVLHPDVSPGPS